MLGKLKPAKGQSTPKTKSIPKSKPMKSLSKKPSITSLGRNYK